MLLNLWTEMNFIHTLETAHEPLLGMETLNELQTTLKHAQRTRHLAFGMTMLQF